MNFTAGGSLSSVVPSASVISFAEVWPVGDRVPALGRPEWKVFTPSMAGFRPNARDPL